MTAIIIATCVLFIAQTAVITVASSRTGATRMRGMIIPADIFLVGVLTQALAAVGGNLSTIASIMFTAVATAQMIFLECRGKVDIRGPLHATHLVLFMVGSFCAVFSVFQVIGREDVIGAIMELADRSPHIILASAASFYLAQMVLAIMWSPVRRECPLWMTILICGAVSQAIGAPLFSAMALWNSIEPMQLLELIISSFVVKSIAGILLLPLAMLAITHARRCDVRFRIASAISS